MKLQKLREALAETRSREAELDALCTDAPADPSGRWLPKDHLAHIAYYREREANMIKAVLAGGEPPPKTDEGHNEVVYAANRDVPASEVIANAHRSWDHLMAEIGACTEEDLERPHPNRPASKLIDGSPGDHLGAHLMWCHLDAGDELAAEAAVRWAWDLSSRTFDDPRSNSLGAYNVACFYARTGRVEEALPLLRQGFQGAPDLREWSLKDPDLDPIREDPRVAELLATPSRP